MKKLISLVLILVFVMGFASLSFAKEANKKVVVVTDKITGETMYVEKTTYDLIERQKQERIKKYLSKEEIAFIENVIKIKEENQGLSNEELVDIIFGNEVTSLAESKPGIWESLTPSEQLLVVLYPIEALSVNACKKDTDAITNTRYPNWKDGDKGNSFRHALWNAMMSVSIGKSLAKSFADAHEAVINPNTGKVFTDTELSQVSWLGFTGLQHKNMDLHNNQKGRDCVAWYEFIVSNTTLANRVQTKIDNGEMVILQN